MRYWTYAEIKAKVQGDLGIEQEEFVTDSELMGYCNAAIDEAEAEIHTIYEDYFLTYGNISFVSGTEGYSLPTDIYANKIRGVMFTQEGTVYPIERFRYNAMFDDITMTTEFDPNGRYRYYLTNPSAATGISMNIVPAPRDSITNALKVWYIRNANRITADADICDIPEFVQFVLTYMKFRVYEKEGHPNVALYAGEGGMIAQQKRQMIATLSNMIDDGDTEIEKDLTIYEDMAYGLTSQY